MWRVWNNDFVLGHFTGKTAEDAVSKAIIANNDFHTDMSSVFYASKAGASSNEVFEVRL